MEQILKRVLPKPVKRFIREIRNQRTFVKDSRETDSAEPGLLKMMPQPSLSYFVLNILDHCNLRCKGCDHFAAIARRRFVSVEDITRDLARMSELFDGKVARIGVMGGEPLLHPELKQILAEARRYFPETLIQLVTNGILLMRQDEEFWDVCRKHKIMIVNTKYPIALDWRAMEQTAKAHNVIFSYYDGTGEQEKTSYMVPLDIHGKQEPLTSFKNCFHANSKIMVMEGKIYACTVAPNVHIFNERFGTSMLLQEEDYLNVNEVESKEDVLRFLSKPKPFCRYCNVGGRSSGHPWERSKQDIGEWTT